MICIIIVAGHGAKLEQEILRDESGQFTDLINVPKALLPAAIQSNASSGSNWKFSDDQRILNCWWDLLKSRQQFKEVYLVTNADKYKHYERWATANEFPVPNIVNDGSTNAENSIGAIAALELTIRSKNINDDILVVAGDMIFDQNFSIEQLLDYFKHKKGDLAIYYDLEENKSTEQRGIIEIDSSSGRIVKFLEKPKPEETASRLACPVFYCLCKSTLPYISKYTDLYREPKDRSFGCFMSWLVNEGHTLYGMKLPSQFQLIGKIDLSEYTSWIQSSIKRNEEPALKPITVRTYARVGLIGNPSDGFNGKTISLTIGDFWAEVTIKPSTKLKLNLHPLNDPTEFGSLSDLYGISRREGYLGGLRLLQATCKKFYEYCSSNGIALARKNFSLSYETNIPRQVGLAGSSAIISSTFKCLMKFFNLTENDIPKPKQPQFVLNVEEEELHITAGLQDRVIQIYEGLVYMDFSEELINRQGHGNYIPMEINDLPPLWLAYVSDPSDSGKIHSTVKERWRGGDEEVIKGMKDFAEITDQARDAIETKNTNQLLELMNANFDLRKKLYTEKALGEKNMRMISIGRKYGSSAKFCGSGGAVVGLCLDEKKKYEMIQEFQSEGFVVCDLKPYDGATKGSDKIEREL
ncbi:PREDICTED: glucuronokinase 1-like [Amphimedon queenslandica]|uniref:Nucleotidyl transferase domain-containing protein n=1 Tax=Amphimedon queenslandica TaxID=400682 RepID=A0A1X7URB7_AMPQE|nr:PREDICTED: glucuronokinase 1-like [Amphimedon queenslandica]|eukprot:XP_011404331.1 PREDICTED: glucuronokinase 1-like [Amphimedon queenslandica]